VLCCHPKKPTKPTKSTNPNLSRIYDGDFKTAPGSFKCPVCKAPKSRFKAYTGVVRGKPNNSGGEMKKRFQARQW
jgi:rubredoxin